MRIRLGLLLASACLLLSPTRATCLAANVSEFIDFSEPLVPGRLYVPPEVASSSQPRPLILFLHGAGETGSNNSAQVNGNLDNLLDAAKQRGAFLYAPQAITRTWADTTRTATVMAKIDQAISQYPIDTDRLYVTGLSMGGGGAWNMLNRFADRFAAGVPIAAVSPGGDFNAGNLVGKPTWAFHARDDGVVTSVASRTVVSSILDAASAAPLTYPSTRDPRTTFRYSNEPVGLQFSEWSRGGHGIWGPVYDTPELYDWMFSHTLTTAMPVAPAGGGQIRLDNTTSPILPIANQQAEAIPAGTGFVAVGSFSFSDAEIARTNAANLAALANDFRQFGASVPVGVNGVEGTFMADIGAPLAANDPLLGQNLYLVVGDGIDIAGSESLFVFKSDTLFADVAPAFLTTIALDGNLAAGKILLGRTGTVFANRLGGFRTGIIAAAVNVPEAATAVLAMITIGAFPCRRPAARQNPGRRWR